MLKKYIITVIIVALALNLSACKKSKQRYSVTYLDFFDTVTDFSAYTDSEEEFSALSQKVYDSLKEYHELYDIYNSYDSMNNLKTINDNAGIKPVKVDQKIIDLLEFGKEACELSGGKVNIAFGAVLQVWHDYRTKGIDDPENAQLPPADVLKEKSKHTDISQMIIDKEQSTVYLKDSGMSLDVGAVAKGYAAEMTARILIQEGLKSGMLSVGGNVRTIGSKADGEAWNVGIQNPDLTSDKTYLYAVKLTDYSLVTSGDYQRYYTVNGKKYHHIIDPDTLMPSVYFTSVSIICNDSGLADALSTSLFIMTYEDGLKLIESLPDTEALWILKDGEVKYSSGFQAYLKEQ